MQVGLSRPRPFLCVQFCNDGVEEGDSLGHIGAELGVFLWGCFLQQKNGAGGAESFLSTRNMEKS